MKLVSTYKRRPPSFVAQCLFSVFIYGFAGPIARILDKVGHLDWLFRFATAARIRAQKSANPFRNYVPAKHDVFVATFAKSGTSWMMQIANTVNSARYFDPSTVF